MNRRTLIILLVALGLFVIGVIGALAFTGNSESHPMMTMPDGRVMEHHLMTEEMATMEMDGETTTMEMP